MLLLFADSLLLFFVTTSLGIITTNGLEKFFRIPVRTDVLGIFLTGLIVSTVYFNILSFWLPVNYLSLIPLVMISFTVIRQFRTIFHRPYLLPLTCLFIVLLVYLAIPPLNIDSSDYHFKTIQWYETYKVVPGLANVHGRFAFDAASFIIQAAYSFSPLTGQAIFPLNGVLTALFLGWILTRVFQNKASYTGLAWFLLLILLSRPMLINVSSPVSDILVLVCIAYPVLRLFESLLSKTVSLTTLLIPLLIILYAPIAKLSAYPTWLLFPYLFFVLPKIEKRKTLFIVVILSAGLLYLPWLARNYIMSGYLVYPFPYLDFFHPDWKAPKDVLLVDYNYIKCCPLLLPLHNNRDWALAWTISFRQWFPFWLSQFFSQHLVADMYTIIISLLSPLIWVAGYARKKKPDIKLISFGLTIYACVWIWIKTSPDYRFGVTFIALSIVLPLLYLAYNKPLPGKMQKAFLPALLGIFFLYYSYDGFKQSKLLKESKQFGFTLRTCWLFPLKSYRTTVRNNLADFPYKTLQSGVRLYLSDPGHDCLNGPLPCMSWKYGEIEMRGSRMDEGFRNVRNEVRKYYPFIK